MQEEAGVGNDGPPVMMAGDDLWLPIERRALR